GSLSAGDLRIGIPAVSDLAGLGQAASARKIGLVELTDSASAPPQGVALGGSARATFAVLELAERSVTEGLVHPQLQHGGRAWLAYLGGTVDGGGQEELAGV